MDKIEVLIVGAGPAGISAVLWSKRLELDHLLLETNKTIGGQMVQIHNKIIDYPGIVATNGVELQQVFAQQVEDMSCNIKLNCPISFIDVKNNHVLFKENNLEKKLIYKYLIIATGSKPKTLNVPGEKEMLQRGEIYSATRDKYQFQGKTVAIIGGGDRAFEGALLLAEAGAHVILIHRTTRFKARKAYQERVFTNNNIQLHTNTIVLAIEGKDKVEKLIVVREGQKESFKIDAVISRIGVIPNTILVKGQVETDNEGYIVVNQFGQSNIPTIFAVGDVCNRPAYSSLSSSIGQGMIATKRIAQLLNGEEGSV